MATSRDDEETRAVPVTGTGPAGVGVASAARASMAPGSLIAGRYRVVALLGRGGMGEVYRADDLLLDQPVALKLLPESAAQDEGRLAQLHHELRTARQISHRNVCRLYDLGDADGRRFLSMEYVDGEDLASLLRRIGRIPHDKAVEIARQLCAGVAAAHDRGVVHRDLKPANVMIDGDGNVRITDFGIATAAARAGDEFAGTPRYMAPEQIAGRPASVASDIYALGLILYEIFTGRRAVEGDTFVDLRAFHETGTVSTPSSHVRDLDPAVERVILRCLDRDPQRRPASALAVAAALPGANPLAAALAAGETPSPDLLAAAGETEALAVAPAVALVAFAAMALLAIGALSPRASIAGRVPLDLPPAVLVDRAQQAIAAFGYPTEAGDSAFGFVQRSEVTGWLYRTRAAPDRYAPVATGRPPAIVFWYRTAPRALRPLSRPVVTPVDPPSEESDMRAVVLDGRGRLVAFRSVPPQHEIAAADSTPSPPWHRAFEAAGLDMAAFSSVTPEWTPRDYADSRAAWEGPLPDSGGLRVRVEASAYRGRPVSFAIVGPWTRPALMDPAQQSRVDRTIAAVLAVLLCLVFLTAAVLARRNLRAQRADRRGAARLAAFVAAAGSASWLLAAHHAASLDVEFNLVLEVAAEVLFAVAMTWALYIALEPHVRRLWPDGLLGWSRLLAGHIRDPRVGRDVLTGVAAGTAATLADIGRAMVIPWLGYPAPTPNVGTGVELLAGPSLVVSAWLGMAVNSVASSLLFVLIVVLIRLALRRAWLFVPATILLLSLVPAAGAGTTTTWLVVVFPIAAGALLAAVMMRAGVLAFTVTWGVFALTRTVPMMPDVSRWSAGPGNWTIAAIGALTVFGFLAARGPAERA